MEKFNINFYEMTEGKFDFIDRYSYEDETSASEMFYRTIAANKNCKVQNIKIIFYKGKKKIAHFQTNF